MMKNKLRTVLILAFLFVTATTVAVIANDPIGSTFDFTIYTQIENGVPQDAVTIEKDYGSTVTFDAGTYNASYDFATYLVNNKVEFALPENNTFIVNQELVVNAVYRATDKFMVAFMNANQDLIGMDFVTNDGTGDATPPVTSGLAAVPGYMIDPTTPWLDGSYIDVLEDTVLHVNYVVDGTPSTHTVTVTNGTADEVSYNFNQVATVTASGGTGNFQHWEKDGMIVSLNPIYSFTVLENTTLTAVYDTPASPSSDVLFLNLLPYSGIVTDYSTWVGQFNLPDGHELIEYGVISSSYFGGITLNTPDVEKIQSNKYNPNTKEFVRHLDDATYGDKTIRGYMITTDGANETITYSDFLFDSYATDLFISEYIEGSSDNKAIEIYNGTNSNVDLSIYSVELYSNGSTEATSTLTLSGSLDSGAVFVISNSSSVSGILNVSNINSGVANFNGDDALSLSKSGVVIDEFGQIGIDPGSSWTVGTGSTAERTLVRNPNVTGPTSDWDSTEWTVYGQDNFDYIGSHNVVIPKSISISGFPAIDQGDAALLTASSNPTIANNVLWSSSNEAIATIDSDGNVTTTGAGEVTFYATSPIDTSVYGSHDMQINAVDDLLIVFDPLNGNEIFFQNVSYGQQLIEPDEPTAPLGLTFIGWFLWWPEIMLYNFDDAVTESFDLEAYYGYTVTFDSNEGSTVPLQMVIDEDYSFEPSLILEPTDPTKSGYTFGGWYTDDGTFLDEFDFLSTAIYADITLYAKWNVPSPDLFISEYAEADGGDCKYIEIYNPTGAAVDLSTYSVNKASNGGGWGTALTLTGTLNAGETIVIAASACTSPTDAAQTAGNPAYPTTGITEVQWGSADWNGDDAIGLFKDGTLIDVIGTPDVDPGTRWYVGDGNITDGSTENVILIRVPSVLYGSIDWSIGATQWIVTTDNRDYSDVGTHTVTGGSL